MKWRFVKDQDKGWLLNEDGVKVPIEQSVACLLSILGEFQDIDEAINFLCRIGLIRDKNRSIFRENIVQEYNIFVRAALREEIDIPTITGILQKRFSPIKCEDYSFPHSAMLYITPRCNMTCQYCYWKSKVHKGPELEAKEYYRVINELTENGVSSLLISGGEPFEYHELIPVLDYAIMQGMHIKITTKHVFSDTEIKSLFDLGKENLELILSLDSLNSEKSARLYGRIDFIDQMINNIVRLREANISFSIQPIANAITVEEYPHIIEKLLDMGANSVVVGRYASTSHKQDDIFSINKQRWEEVYSWISDKNDSRIGTLVTDIHGKMRGQCRSGNASITILWDGKVVRCEHLAAEGKNLLGDITHETISEIWNNKNILAYNCIMREEK